MTTPGIVGSRVRLVPLDEERHFETCLRWVNDPGVTATLLLDFPVSRMAERQFFQSLTGAEGSEHIFAIELLDGTHIGNSGLHRIDYRHGIANTGSFIGEANLRGHGYGTEAAVLRSHYAFNILGLRQLYSSYLGSNPGSAAMQAKVGYVVAGVLPLKYWKAGEWRDEMITYLDRERFYSLHPRSQFGF